MMPGLREISAALQAGQTTSMRLVEAALERAQSTISVFIEINSSALRTAEVADRNRQQNSALAPLAGIPVALKDLFNVSGEVTMAGSVIRKHYAKAEPQDADVIAPLREAGFVFLGRTNMSEFAFSGMGKNPHFGTPPSIWDRQTGRLPGGSSSGSAVSVAQGIVAAALGSDTAGSCRIPAAFNGIVGVKPSFGRMSLQGIYPLSPTTDAPGPLAVDVDSCFLLDQLMCGRLNPGDALPCIPSRPVESLHLVVPESIVVEDIEPQVQTAFSRSVDALREAGVKIDSVPMPVLDDCVSLFSTRAVALYEAYQHHREMLDAHPEEYDPFVGQRLLSGADITAEEQQDRYQAKQALVDRFNQQFDQLGVDAIIYPTVMCIPPAISETEDLEQARGVNAKCLRNSATANYFDGCSISLPCQRQGDAPVGFMLSAKNGMDEALYSTAATVEGCLGLL